MAELGPRQISARLQGASVAGGTISVDDLIGLLDNLQLALRRIAEGIADAKRGRHPGRFPQSVVEQSTLRLLKIADGSFEALLELERPTPQQRMFDLGEEALEQLLENLSQLATGDSSSLPPAAEPQIREMIRSVRPGIDAITFQGGPKRTRARFDIETVDKIPGVIAPSRHRLRQSGRLREVDFKDHTAELYDPSGRMARVLFAPEQETTFRAAANMMVTIEGMSEERATGTVHIEAESVHMATPREEFWQIPSIARLAEDQNIGPISRGELDKANFWPSSEDPDEFVRMIYDARRSSRAGGNDDS